MRYAYVTTLCGGDAYVPGVEALGRSLAASGTSEPRIVLVTSDVTVGARTRLSKQGWEVRDVEPIDPPSPSAPVVYPRFARTFTKLRAFALSDVKKIVLLDADTLVMRNVDELFERPSPAAAPDFFLPDRFNSGVMVIEPSPQLFASIEGELGRMGSYDGGDQGFLNALWPDWYEGPSARRLPAGFNMHHFVFQFLINHDALRERLFSEVRILHFTLQKPWMGLTLSGGSSLWWKFFGELEPDKSSGLRKQLHRLEDWSFGSLVKMIGG
jgi:glycogenin glucosyltransferase